MIQLNYSFNPFNKHIALNSTQAAGKLQLLTAAVAYASNLAQADTLCLSPVCEQDWTQQHHQKHHHNSTNNQEEL